MPHLILEFSSHSASDEQVATMLDAVHNAAFATGLFEECHIKTRAIPVAHFRTGTGQDPFMHAQLRIKKGRTEDQKNRLSAMVLEAIKNQMLDIKVITVEIVDMDSATYAKHTA